MRCKKNIILSLVVVLLIFGFVQFVSAADFDGDLFSPTNGITLTVNSTDLNYTTDSENALNCSVYIWYNNGSLQNSFLNYSTGGDNSLALSNYDDNIYNWNVYCVNASNSTDDLWLNSTLNWTFTIATHSFHGFALNASNKNQGMNNTNVTFTIYTNIMRDTIFRQYITNADSSGWYNLTNISFPTGHYFKVDLVKYNETNTHLADFVGPSIPEFGRSTLTGSSIGPGGESESIQNITFYMKKGATINISSHNGDGVLGTSNFSFYQVKDKLLGFPIAIGSTMGSGIVYTNFSLNLPANRNYTVMIYPNNGMPVSKDISSTDLNDGYFNYSFNTNETMNKLTGYVDVDDEANFTSLYVVTYLLEPGRMVYFGEHAEALLNISGNDFYNTTSGFYNITIPGSYEDVEAIIMPVAFNKSGDGLYYGGFKSVNLDWTGPSETNFSLKKFKGDYNNPVNLSVQTWGNGPSSGVIKIPKINFNILKANSQEVSSPFVEMQLDYSSLDMTNFTYITDGSSPAFPLLDGVGIKKMNIFSQSGAPLKKKFTNSSLPGVGNGSSVNLILSQSMGAKDASGTALENMFIDMIQNSDACNVPNYNVSECSFFGSQQDKSDFNPFGVVMSGAEMSFVMKNANNITVIYKNVDMLASGPPDIAFDTDPSNTESSSAFEQAWKFGSSGPEIYDEIIIGIPYIEGSTSQTGFNESADMNLTIPYLYDENYNVIWDESVNGTSNITNAGNEHELSDFADYIGSEYEAYLNETNVVCNESDVNLTTGLCYKDLDNNMLWFKIPHFSGVGPAPTGKVITATSSDDTDEDDSSSSSTTGASSSSRQPQKRFIWSEMAPGVANIMKDFDAEIGVKEISINVKNAAQNVRITVTKQDGKPADVSVEKSGKVYQYLQIETENLDDNLESAVVSFRVEKDWMDENGLEKENIAAFKFGEDVWNELVTEYVEDDDDFYYFDVELKSFSYFAISEKEIVEEETTEETEEEEEEEVVEITEVEEPVEEPKSYLWLWIVLILLIISVAAVAVYMKFYKK